MTPSPHFEGFSPQPLLSQASGAAASSDTSTATGGDAQGTQMSLEHNWGLPLWVSVLLLVGCAAYVIANYLREAGRLSMQKRLLLAALRMAALGTILFMMHGPVLRRSVTQLPDLVLVLDLSQSMSAADEYEEQALREAVAELAAEYELPANPTRLDLARAQLLGENAELLDELALSYNVKLYLVGDRVRPPLDPAELPAELAELLPEDEASQLGGNLSEIIALQQGHSTAAIVFWTDGITTSGPTLESAAQIAARRGIPLHLIGLGSGQPPRDIEVSNVVASDMVFVGSQATFDVRLSTSGYEGESLELVLRDDETGEVLAQETVTPGPEGSSQLVRLSYRPPAAGTVSYSIGVDPLPEEKRIENNSQSGLLEVTDEKLRVLLVDSQPRYEFRYLKALLERPWDEEGRNTNPVELTTVLQQADPRFTEIDSTAERFFPITREDLFQYDVIILGDVDPRLLDTSSMEDLAAFVTERGGGLVMIAGPRHMPHDFEGTPLAELMPFDITVVSAAAAGTVGGFPAAAPPSTNPVNLQPTRLGLATPALALGETAAETNSIWQDLPPVFWILPIPTSSPSASVLAENPALSGSSGQHQPVILSQYLGAGLVLFHATDETWRWRWRRGDDLFGRYWLQQIRQLGRARLASADRSAVVIPQRQVFAAGEPVGLTVRFLRAAAAPQGENTVTLQLEAAGGERRKVELAAAAESPVDFAATIAGLAPGQYTATLVDPELEGDPPQCEFIVAGAHGESSRIQLDAAALERAARLSSGRYYTLAEASRLVKELPEGSEIPVSARPAVPIWNAWPLAALFIVLLIGEWVLRKRWGLI